MPSTRPETPAPSRRLAGLPGYGNGRAGAAQAFAHRLGSNEAPDGLAPAILEAVVPALAAANRYPDLRGETLAAALARRHGLLPENVAVAAGSIVLLGQIVRAWCDPGDGIVAPWRSYEAYPIIAGLAGGRLVEAPLDRDHRLDPAAILARIGADTRIALICNPNNPTGTALAPTVLDDLLADVPSQVLIVLDEAYCDYSDEAPTAAASPARRLARHPNLVIPRTFSKAWGLAGIRAGYALAAPTVIAAIQAAAPPFLLPGVALAAALAVLANEALVRTRVGRNAVERVRLSNGLSSAGLPVAQSAAKFIWLPVGPAAEALTAHFRAAGIAVRCFAGEGVRITTGTPADSEAVLAAAHAWPGLSRAEGPTTCA